jgi:hypothetical protein
LKAIAYACDIGSIKSGSFAWARNDAADQTPTVSVDIDDLIASMVGDAKAGMTIAIGFEAPLFMPIPDASADLNSGRNKESSRSMFAPTGAAVTTIAIHETARILKKLRASLGTMLTLTTDWRTCWRSRNQNQEKGSYIS